MTILTRQDYEVEDFNNFIITFGNTLACLGLVLMPIRDTKLIKCTPLGLLLITTLHEERLINYCKLINSRYFKHYQII